MAPTMLINWVFFMAVGHVVEALKVAMGYRAANPTLEIWVLLNSESPCELVEACSAVTGCVAIDLRDVLANGERASCLASLPTSWDYIIDRHHLPERLSPELDAFQRVARRRFTARRSRQQVFLPRENDGLVPWKDAPLRLRLPKEHGFEAGFLQHRGTRVGLLLAGHGGAAAYPSLRWWGRLVNALSNFDPSTRFLVTGRFVDGPGHGTFMQAYSEAELRAFLAQHPEIVNGFNIGLWAQLSLIQQCDVLIAPHTGFAFLASCFETRWLALSGGPWPEYLFNQVPFLCILPRCESYPCFGAMRPGCYPTYSGQDHYACMSDDVLDHRIDDVVDGFRRLRDPRFDYRSALAHHKECIDQAPIDREALCRVTGLTRRSATGNPRQGSTVVAELRTSSTRVGSGLQGRSAVPKAEEPHKTRGRERIPRARQRW